MAQQFDISEHITVETLGTRAGFSDGLGTMTVNGRQYAESGFSVTNPLLIDPTILKSLMNSQQELYGSDYKNVYLGSSEFHSSPASTSYLYWDTTSSRTYNIYIKDVTDGSFDPNEDPKITGTLFSTMTYPTSDPMPAVGITGFSAPYGKYHVAVYAGTTTLIGKFYSPISQPQFDPFVWTDELGNSLAIENSSSAYITTFSDPANPGNPNDSGTWEDYTYSVYFDGVLSTTFILQHSSATSVSIGIIPVAFNTALHVEVIREDSLVVEDFYVQVKFRDDYNNVIQSSADYPNNTSSLLGLGPAWDQVTAIADKLTSTTLELFWNIEILPEGISNWPAGATPNNYRVKVYGSDESFFYYEVPAETSSDLLAVRAENFYLILEGLDTNNKSYLIDIFFEDPSDQQYYIYHTASYGINPPTRPEVDPDYIVATGWWPIQCSVTGLNFEAGYEVEKGLLKRPEPGTASIILKGDEADPRRNTAVALDAKIRIMLEAAASPNDTTDYLYSGFIESMSTSYDTRGNSITSINAIDAMSRVLNVNIPVYEFANDESFSNRMYNVLTNYIQPATWGVSIDTVLYPILEQYDGSRFPPEYRENVSSSEVINELTEGEYAVMVQNRAGVIFWLNRAAPVIFQDPTLVNQPPSFGFSTVHDESSLDHFCISDFKITNSIEDITNRVIAKLSYDDQTEAVAEDQASITRYGERSFEVQLNLDAPDGNPAQYLESWIAEVPYIEDTPEFGSITTNVVNRNGFVTRAYEVDVTLDPVRVYIKTGAVDFNGTLYARKTKHEITPEGWTMTLDLTAD